MPSGSVIVRPSIWKPPHRPENHSAPAPMRGNIDVESGGAQHRKVGDGRFRAGQHHEIGVAGQRRTRAHANEIDVGLGVERIEIVEISDMRQNRDCDTHPRLRLRRPALLQRERVLRRQQAGVGKVGN